MSDQAINLLLQIPLAGVVVFVVVIFLKYLKEMIAQMINFMAQQAETNRQFLSTQREQMNLAIGRLADELKAMREELAEERGIREGKRKNRNL
ncbi:MAG: hypothetical protein HUU11_16820 [Anaerolineales bacterium]|nr:hypothetical protein [Anaerolineales bacterium]